MAIMLDFLSEVLITPEQVKWLHEKNMPVHEELRKLTEPLANATAAHVRQELIENPEVVRETAERSFMQKNLPFGDQYLLPPRLFGPLNGREAPVIPVGEHERAELVEAFQDSSRTFERDYGADLPRSLEYDPRKERNALIWQLRTLRLNGQAEIDPDKWNTYREAALEQAFSGEYHSEIITMRRHDSIRAMRKDISAGSLHERYATGDFENFMMARTASLNDGGYLRGLIPTGYIFMPVGEYGEQMHQKLLHTYLYCINTTFNSGKLESLASNLTLGHEELIEKHTARGKDGGLLATTIEGWRSIFEATTLLMAEKIPEYEDGNELWQAIVDQKMVEKLTRVMPMGVLGPTILAGKYFPGLLKCDSSGQLSLDKDLVEVFQYTKRHQMFRLLGKWADYWRMTPEERASVQPPGMLFWVCPAARGESLTLMNQAAFAAGQLA